jgi:hypothetical protein
MFRSVALLALGVGLAHSVDLLRGKRALPEADPNYNETLGNDGGPDGLGVQPKMVPIGHFGLNKYAAKLGEMTQKGMRYRPLLVPPGHFSGTAPPAPALPPVKPMMIPPGAFKAAAMAKRALETAKANGTLVEQQENVCKIMDKVLGLARFTYLIETEDSKKASDSKGILSIVDVVCPLLKRRYSSAMCHNTCAGMRANVDRFFDAKYVGPVYPNMASKCQGVNGQEVNFAVLYALSSARAMFNLTFCPAVSMSDCPEGSEPVPDYHKLKAQAKAVGAAGSASDDDKEEDMVDVAKAEAEARAMEAGTPPRDEVERKAREEADKYMYNMMGQKCCKACNNCPRCVMCSVGTVIVPDNPNGGDDVYNHKNMHNVVTDDEAGGVNKPRGPTVLKPVNQ